MKLLLLALLCEAAVMPAKPLDRVQRLFVEKQYRAVITELSDEDKFHSLPAKDMAKAHLLLAMSLRNTKQIDRAIGVLQVGAQLYPNDINLLSELADLLEAAELDDRARPLYERVLKIHPNNGRANLGLARINHGLGMLDEALSYYDRALAEDPKNASVWSSYADALAQKREYVRAITAIQRSLAIEPENADSLHTLARLFYRTNSHAEAYEALDRAMAARQSRESGAAQQSRPELMLQRALWLLEDRRYEECAAASGAVLRSVPDDPLGLWIRGVLAARRGDKATAHKDFARAAQGARRAPFVAAMAKESLKQLETGK